MMCSAPELTSESATNIISMYNTCMHMCVFVCGSCYPSACMREGYCSCRVCLSVCPSVTALAASASV